MKFAGWLAVLGATLAGCVQNEYDIELTPAGKFLERNVTIRRHGPEGSADELQRLGKEYNVPPPAPAKMHAFQGRFAGRTPDDVGGFGTFTRWDTALGSVVVYVERFRGNIDAAGELKRRQAAADRTVELLLGWLERELKKEPQWPALQKFLDEEFRRDLFNLSITAWTLGLTDRSDEIAEPIVRAAQYLVERGYMTPDEIPAIRRAFDDTKREDYERLLTWLRKLIVARMGDERAPPLTFQFLASPERLMGSLRAFLETTEEYSRLEQAWQVKLNTDPAALRPDAINVAGELLGRLFAGAIQLGGDQLSLALKTGRPPILTNGRWSSESGKVQWPEKRLLPGEELPPILTYAAWDEPNETLQKTHFGKIVLQGKALVDYCTWYHGLTDAEQQEWDLFLDKLRPGPTLAMELDDFRFNNEPVEGDKNRGLARPAVEAIQRELTP